MLGHLSVQCLLVSYVFGIGGAVKSVRNHIAVSVDARGNVVPEEEPCDESSQAQPGMIRDAKDVANQSQMTDAGAFFNGLLVSYATGLSNLTNYTTMVRTSPGASTNPWMLHKIGLNVTADVDLLHSKVEGLYKFLKPSPWVPASIAEKCPHGDFQNFARCLSSALCVLQKGVTMHAISTEAFALLAELSARYFDGSHNDLVQWVGHVTQSNSQQHDQDQECEWASMEHEAAHGLNQTLSDMDEAIDNAHDVIKNLVEKAEGGVDHVHRAMENVCRVAGCDRVMYRDVHAASHAHTMKLMEHGVDVRKVRRDIERRHRMHKLIKEFLRNYPDELTRMYGEGESEGKVVEQIEQYFRRCREAFQRHASHEKLSLAEQETGLTRWWGSDVLQWAKDVTACLGHVSWVEKAGYKWSIYNGGAGGVGVSFAVTLQASIPAQIKTVWTKIVSRQSVSGYSFSIKAAAAVVIGVGGKIAGLASASLGVGCATSLTYSHNAGSPSALTLSLTLGEMGTAAIASSSCPFGRWLGPATCMAGGGQSISIMCCKVDFFSGSHDCR